MRCSCEFTSNNIIHDAFSCQGSQGEFTDSVVYRAMITLLVPASIIDADNIVINISQWVQNKPRVRVDGITRDIDPSCPTILDSFNSNDCVIEVPTNQTNPTSSSSSSSLLSSTSEIIIAAAAVVVVIVLIVIVIINVVYCRRKSKKYRYYTVIVLLLYLHKIFIAHRVHRFVETSYQYLTSMLFS